MENPIFVSYSLVGDAYKDGEPNPMRAFLDELRPLLAPIRELGSGERILPFDDLRFAEAEFGRDGQRGRFFYRESRPYASHRWVPMLDIDLPHPDMGLVARIDELVQRHPRIHL